MEQRDISVEMSRRSPPRRIEISFDPAVRPRAENAAGSKRRDSRRLIERNKVCTSSSRATVNANNRKMARALTHSNVFRGRRGCLLACMHTRPVIVHHRTEAWRRPSRATMIILSPVLLSKDFTTGSALEMSRARA